VQDKLQKFRASTPSDQPAGPDPIAPAMDRYKDRMLQLFQPQRSGTTVTFVHLDGQNPQQQQILNVLIIAAVTEHVKPLIEKKWSEMMKPQPADLGPGVAPPGAAPPGAPGAAP
jgi:hypothetical protein